MTLEDLTEIFQLRSVLEGLAARLATPLFATRELDAIAESRSAAEAALEEGDLRACSHHGKTLHDAIIDKADSQRLASIIRNLDDHVQRFRILSDQISDRLPKSVKEHRAVLAALRDKDPCAAEKAMRGHLDSVLLDLSSYDEVSARSSLDDEPGERQALRLCWRRSASLVSCDRSNRFHSTLTARRSCLHILPFLAPGPAGKRSGYPPSSREEEDGYATQWRSARRRNAQGLRRSARLRRPW